MTTILVAVLGMFASVMASQGFWEFVKSRRKKLTPAERLTMAMGRDRLIFVSKSYLKRGYIPEDEYEMYVEMGNSYLDMGGNHFGEKLFKQAKELPVRDE